MFVDQLAEFDGAILDPEAIFAICCCAEESDVPAVLRREKDKVRILGDRGMTKGGEGDEWVILRVNHQRGSTYLP